MTFQHSNGTVTVPICFFAYFNVIKCSLEFLPITNYVKLLGYVGGGGRFARSQANLKPSRERSLPKFGVEADLEYGIKRLLQNERGKLDRGMANFAADLELDYDVIDQRLNVRGGRGAVSCGVVWVVKKTGLVEKELERFCLAGR